MKTLIIIVCTLAVMMVHGLNKERRSVFRINMLKCSNELGDKLHGSLKATSAHLFICACAKDGNILDQNDQFIQHETLKLFEDIIEDKTSVKRAKKLFNRCYNHVGTNYGRFGNEYKDSYGITKCISSIIPLVIIIWE